MWKPRQAQLTITLTESGSDIQIGLVTTSDGDVQVQIYGGGSNYSPPFGARWLLKVMEIMREIAEASK